MAWDTSGDLVSIGVLDDDRRSGVGLLNGQITRSVWRNRLGLLDSESNPNIWSPRFSKRKECDEGLGFGGDLESAHSDGDSILFFSSLAPGEEMARG